MTGRTRRGHQSSLDAARGSRSPHARMLAGVASAEATATLASAGGSPRGGEKSRRRRRASGPPRPCLLPVGLTGERGGRHWGRRATRRRPAWSYPVSTRRAPPCGRAGACTP